MVWKRIFLEATIMSFFLYSFRSKISKVGFGHCVTVEKYQQKNVRLVISETGVALVRVTYTAITFKSFLRKCFSEKLPCFFRKRSKYTNSKFTKIPFLVRCDLENTLLSKFSYFRGTSWLSRKKTMSFLTHQQIFLS